MSSEKLFQGRLSLFYPKTFLFLENPDRNEKLLVLNQSDPGFLFRSAGWLSVRILHSEDQARRVLQDQRKHFRRKILRFFFM